MVCFNPRFLGFAREYNFVPRACHVRAAWEKGKVERTIGYVRQNFWPLRSFTSLADVNAQARQWLKEVANRRKHRETSQSPDERFQPESLKPLPAMVPDYRDAAEALVHKDIRLSFDGNRYCVPPRYVGHKLTVKADASSVTIYDQHHEVACSPALGARRNFRRGAFSEGTVCADGRRRHIGVATTPGRAPDRLHRLISNGLPIPIARCPARSANCSDSLENMGRKRSLRPSRKPTWHALSEPIMSATFFASSYNAVKFSRRSSSRTRS